MAPTFSCFLTITHPNLSGTIFLSSMNEGNPERPSAAQAPIVRMQGEGVNRAPWSIKISSRQPELNLSEVKQLAEWVKRDIRDGQQTNPLSMITALLQMVTPHVEYRQCLQEVLSIANDPGLEGHLQDYTTQTVETGVYAPFTKLCNKAWDSLSAIEIDGLPAMAATDDDRLVFHWTDNKVPTRDHHSLTGVDVDMKPDVAIWSKSTAEELNEDEERPNDYTAYAKNPKITSKWSQWLLSCEFKWSKGKPRHQLGGKYKLVEVIEPPLRKRKGDLFLKIDDEGNDIVDDEDENLVDEGDYPVLGESSKKRGNLTQLRGSSNKRSKTLTRRVESTIVQCARYAIEQLTSSFRRTHVINLLIEDDILWILWFDRRGFIQAQGFDFIVNFPHFLALILILQRCTPTQWGFSPRFISVDQVKASPLDVPFAVSWAHEPGEFFVDIPIFSFGKDEALNGKMVRCKIRRHGNDSYIRYALGGRATRVQDCDLVQLPGHNDPEVQKFIDDGTDKVVKIYWAQDTRTPHEEEVIKLATERGGDDRRVKGHLPTVYCACGFDDSSTGTIRRNLALKDLTGARSLRLIVFKKLQPLSCLTGMPFWKAFWQCFWCDYALQAAGIDHSDISPGNLMYDPTTGEGILNDFDLAHVVLRDDDGSATQNRERTGTMPFMALELLTEIGWSGKLPRAYQQSAESFAWSLAWICGRYVGGKSLIAGGKSEEIQFDGWLAMTPRGCLQSKLLTLTELPMNVPDPALCPFAAAVDDLLFFWKKRFDQSNENRLRVRFGREVTTTASRKQEDVANEIIGIVTEALSSSHPEAIRIFEETRIV